MTFPSALTVGEDEMQQLRREATNSRQELPGQKRRPRAVEMIAACDHDDDERRKALGHRQQKLELDGRRGRQPIGWMRSRCCMTFAAAH